MTPWLPITASLAAVAGIASMSLGGDCATCSAPPAAASAPPAAVAPADQPAVERPLVEDGPVMADEEVFVLKFHADWCPKCRSLDPVYNAVSKSFSDKPVAFVKLDVTNDTKKKEAGETMKALGLEELWKANQGKNGFLLLVDAETKAAGKKLKAGTTEDQATKAINDALDS